MEKTTLVFIVLTVVLVGVLGYLIISSNINSQPDVNGKDIVTMQNGMQVVDLRIGTYGYNSDKIILKQGVPVKFMFTAQRGIGCGSSLVIPDFNVRMISTNGETQTAEFTPTKPGTYRFSCMMNMYRGTIVVQ